MHISQSTNQSKARTFRGTVAGEMVVAHYRLTGDLTNYSNLESRHISSIVVLSDGSFPNYQNLVEPTKQMIVYEIRRSTKEDLR